MPTDASDHRPSTDATNPHRTPRSRRTTARRRTPHPLTERPRPTATTAQPEQPRLYPPDATSEDRPPSATTAGLVWSLAHQPGRVPSAEGRQITASHPPPLHARRSRRPGRSVCSSRIISGMPAAQRDKHRRQVPVCALPSRAKRAVALRRRQQPPTSPFRAHYATSRAPPKGPRLVGSRHYCRQGAEPRRTQKLVMPPG
jgi:hypothetical protein